MRLEGVVDQVRPFHIARGIETLDASQLFGGAHPFVGQVDVVVLFIDLEVLISNQLSSDAIRLGVFTQVVMSRAGDDERRPGFVDQDIVDFRQ